MLHREVGHKGEIASGLEGLAHVVATHGQPAWAARLWGEAEALREAIDVPRLPVDRRGYEQGVATVRAQLGEEAFAIAWQEGRTMSPEQALAASGELSASPPTYPNGLTTREVEVLRVVAQGLTNEQVAQRLVISPRTVDMHLTSIYSKIGVSSRGAATRYAMEHHLL